MISKRFGLLAMVIAAAVMWAIPTASTGKPAKLREASEALKQATANLGNALDNSVDKTISKTDAALRKTKAAAAAAKSRKAGSRATATDPSRQPPMHGSNPHAQGSVTVADLDPSNERPLPYDPTGKTSGEDAIVGGARGEQTNGAYHGHITIASLLGSEIAGVDSTEGQTNHGPLQQIQTGLLDPLCQNTGQQACISVLTADSTTTATGSDNDFAVARASVLGIGVGAAESHGTITEDSTCQTATGASRVANVVSPGGGAVAQVSDSTTQSKSCQGQAPVITNTSHVIGLGGVQVPLPAAGCANGTADTVTGIPGVLPIVCNAEDVAGAAAVREALDVYALQVGSNSLLKATTASSEAFSVAPAVETANTPQCSDGVDNDGDGVIDDKDPGCHSDGNAKNADSYNPNDNDETDRNSGTGGSGGNDKAQCNDNKDNDGDGKIDAADPGCHVGNNINNAYNPNDDSEGSDGGNGGNAGTGGQSTNASELPFTGSDVVGLTLAGLLLLAGGLLLRRREDTHAAL
jgi:LPXTG-motif cell wall-anchored protein